MLWRYTDMAIFVLRCFILTHPVDAFLIFYLHASFLRWATEYDVPAQTIASDSAFGQHCALERIYLLYRGITKAFWTGR